MRSAKPIRVAIIGGGLGGLALANGLTRRPLEDLAEGHPGFDVHIFEVKPALSERGASVGLAPHAQKALAYCVGDAKGLLQRAEACSSLGSNFMIGSGRNAGDRISFGPPKSMADLKPQDEKQREAIESSVSVVRTSLIHGLANALDEADSSATLHTNMKLVSITTTAKDSQVDLTFEDGQVERFDAVIGADGYRSVVRGFVLGDKAADEAPSATGIWDCRNLVPIETARELFFKPVRQNMQSTDSQDGGLEQLDSVVINDSFNSWAWSGNRGFLLMGPCANRTQVHFILASIEKEPWKDRKRLLTREEVEQYMEGWMDGPVIGPMLDTLFHNREHLHAYSIWHQKKTSTYNNGRLCIIGDAAHATSPAQGSGAAMAFEDAMLLSHLLWRTSSASHLDYAFEAFTETRKDRCQHIIDSSEDMAQLVCGLKVEAGNMNPDTGFFDFEAGKYAQAMKGRWDRIWMLDHEEHRREARTRLEGKIAASKAE